MQQSCNSAAFCSSSTQPKTLSCESHTAKSEARTYAYCSRAAATAATTPAPAAYTHIRTTREYQQLAAVVIVALYPPHSILLLALLLPLLLPLLLLVLLLLRLNLLLSFTTVTCDTDRCCNAPGVECPANHPAPCQICYRLYRQGGSVSSCAYYFDCSSNPCANGGTW